MGKGRGRWLILIAAVVIVAAAVFLVGPQLKTRTAEDSKKQVAAGNAAFKKGEFAEAVSKFKEATKLDPKNAAAQGGLGRSLEATGKLNEAAAAYKASLAVKPDQPEVRYNLAIIYKSQGKDRDAVAELEKAVKLNEKFVGARMILGDLYARLNETDKARKQYQAVLDMKPFGMDPDQIQTKLESLK